ncbi:alcohol dehydrogenase [Cryobacterium frigoriphilum]|uniref:Alcohol dehydrogenase n=2 Tax=Cryobacterium frigoriphilum TaxID=1259150 RepID=A0A4R9A043_9MICO|nr:alcohol dehydrogenase [Cryobacterium frigoriphilum]
MRAVVFAGSERVSIEAVAAATLVDPDDVLVRITRAAICGTDLGLLRHPDHLPVGTILGHEYVGIVDSVGSGVRGFRPGDRVCGSDFIACGRCWWCRRGDHWECRVRAFFGTGTAFGPALAGAQAELLRVPRGDVVLQLLPDSVSDDVGVFFGDVLATAYAAVSRADILPGDTVAVIGGGPVGQVVSMMAQTRGAGPVVLVEPVESRRTAAASLGSLAVDPVGARSLVDSLTDRRGADAVIDAVGGHIGLGSSFGLVRRRGTIVSVGVHHEDRWSLPVRRAFADELTVRFAIGDSMRDRDQFTALAAAGLIDLRAVITRVVPFGDAVAAYEDLLAQRAVKIVLAL